MNTVSRIEMLLSSALSPTHLTVEDDSAAHIGHAHEGSGHFTVTITAPVFEGKNRIERHQLVYQALGDLMKTDIHALRISASSPTEA